MPIVSAYQCPRTKQLFRDRKSYLVHLRQLARNSLNRRAEQRRQDEMDERMLPLYRCATIKDIEEWVMDNPELVFWNCVVKTDPYHYRQYGEKKNREIRERDAKLFRFKSFSLDVRYDEKASNSHVAPLDGVTNWCNQNPSLPTGYPGMRGRFRYETEGEDHLSFDLLKAMRMPNGTASGGHNKASGEVTLFFSDWLTLGTVHALTEREK